MPLIDLRRKFDEYVIKCQFGHSRNDTILMRELSDALYKLEKMSGEKEHYSIKES